MIFFLLLKLCFDLVIDTLFCDKIYVFSHFSAEIIGKYRLKTHIHIDFILNCALLRNTTKPTII